MAKNRVKSKISAFKLCGKSSYYRLEAAQKSEIKKKSDALVGRVNTFIILHTQKFKIVFKIQNM
jgi:hypothetical protein